MRHSIIDFAAGALMVGAAVLSSCAKQEDSRFVPVEGQKVELSVSLTSPGGASKAGTKTTVAWDENTGGIKFADIWVYRSDGSIDAHKRISGTSTTITCTAGERFVYVVANLPEGSVPAASVLSGLRGSFKLSEASAANGIPMTGYGTVTVAKDASISVELVRAMAKIQVDGIKYDASNYLPEKTTITSIFLANAPAVMDYTASAGAADSGNAVYNKWLSGTPSSWYNSISGGNLVPSSSRYTASEVVTSANLGVEVSGSRPYSTKHMFYCLPNPQAFVDDGTGTWPSGTASKTTSLVIETLQDADGDGTAETRYYCIPISNPKANYLYQFKSISLVHSGTDSITPYSSEDLSVTLTVQEWQDGNALDGIGEVTVLGVDRK
ncbi:MAG: DUF4906 domain-containing protein [Bacteroidales bacterium]|nr:DUF4906 domain-containing protein [Bacteroidales bacterium]